METYCANINAIIKSLEIQVGQNDQSFKGKIKEFFPSDMEPKPRQCNAVTLRSGKVIDDSKKNKRDDDERVKIGNEKEDQDMMLNNKPMIKEGNEPRV